MTATEVLREEVREYIDRADDKSLRMVKAILEIEQEDEGSSLEEENWDDLPEELRMSIERGLKEIEEGKGISHEEVKAKYYSQWFKK